MTSVDPTHPAISPPLEPPERLAKSHRRSFATVRVIFALMLREMSTTYGRSPGGYVWAILEPLGMIVILSIAFSLMMRSPSLGDSFILFYASGYLVFSNFRTLEKAVSKSINFSRPLLLYPAVTWLDTILARLLLTLLTNLLNTILLFGGILYFTGSGIVLDFPPIIEAVALATVLGLGVGTFNCMAGGLFPIYNSIWKIATRPLMILSAVLYIYEDLPTNGAKMLWWNPLAHITGLFRSGVFSTYHPQYISVPYILGIALLSLAVGLFFLSSYSADIANAE